MKQGLKAIIKGRASINEKENLKYLNVDSLDVDLLVKNVHLNVKNIYRNNLILSEYIKNN
ncbi:hypothetical protein NQ314_000122 [Rhamnusium bicolor]|uniref:Uncharacterized protein n=1 Tax=Rhamnusium bicolor TaxID=1586634 RepID=A0AAV8ZZA9_9CUCU|nr:hypothetical protein NQ314_000122 [Rhamnusium bicolor]